MFKGLGTAIITPFHDDLSIHYEKMKELIEFQIGNSCKAIIVCGTTGECSTLSLEEKKELINFTVKAVNGRIPVIAGTGTNCTKTTIELSQYAQSLKVDGLLVVTPYYNKCSQEGLFLHFSEIARNTSLPIILYNVPSRTGVNIQPQTVVSLSKISNIVGLKQANSDLAQTVEILSKVESDFNLYSGNDDLTLPILALGGKGVISVLGNVLPNEVDTMCQCYFDGNIETARYMQLKYYDLIKCLFKDVNPIPIKECMNLLDYKVGKTRLPLCKIVNAAKEELIVSLEKLDLL